MSISTKLPTAAARFGGGTMDVVVFRVSAIGRVSPVALSNQNHAA
jgi:hypothetical protein